MIGERLSFGHRISVFRCSVVKYRRTADEVNCKNA